MRGTFQPQRSRCWFEGAVEHGSLVSTAGAIGPLCAAARSNLWTFLTFRNRPDRTEHPYRPKLGVVENYSPVRPESRTGPHTGVAANPLLKRMPLATIRFWNHSMSPMV